MTPEKGTGSVASIHDVPQCRVAGDGRKRGTGTVATMFLLTREQLVPRSQSPFFRQLLLAVLLLFTAVRAAPCADDVRPDDEETAGALRFRRVFAPADRMQDWPKGAVKYLPVEAAEFERLLSTARSLTPGNQVQMAARIAVAQYTAALDGDHAIRGEATLQIVHAVKDPVLLSLDPCNLALGSPRWLEPRPAAAIFGLGDGGRLQTLVERDGPLHVTWSLGGRRDTPETVGFSFELPSCPVSRLALDLPLSLTPLVDRGLLATSSPASGELRRWQIELGGHNRFQLRLVPAGMARQERRLALARQSVVYDLSLRGVEVSAQLNLEAYEEPLRQVTVVLDAPLQLVTALCGDAAVPWSVVSPPDSPQTRVVLTLPEPIRDGKGVLRLRALAPLVSGQRWRLPRIYPQGMFWQEGGATLLIPAPLLAEQLLPVGCRQSSVGPLPASRSGEAAQFEYFAPDATVEVLLTQRRAALQLFGATATDLGNGEMTSRVAADFRTADAAQFFLEARVAPQWTIDALESLPADALDDWSFDPQSAPRTLTVRLAKALTPSRSVRLLVAARRLYAAPRQNLGIDDLVPLRFLAPAEGKQLVTVRATGPYEVKVSGAEKLARISLGHLTAAQLELFSEPPGELLFEDGAGAADLKVALENRKPSYAAVVGVEACLREETLQENYRLRCTPPASGRLDRVLVRLSQRRDALLRWAVVGDDEQAVAARLWPVEEQVAAGRSPEEETWELTLRRPRREPFEIRASRESKLSGPQPVSLASLFEAASQQATLVLRSVGTKSLQIKNNRLKAIPIEAAPPGQCQSVRAAYQYDPLRDVSAAPEPPLLLWSADATCIPRVWAWQGELQSRYAPDGSGQHLAQYRLQNCGETSLRLTLPPTVSRSAVRGLWIDGHAAAARAADAGDCNLTIDLPANEKYPTVTIHFRSEGDGLPRWGRLAPPLPEADVPVLWQHWSILLPPGYELPEYEPDPTRSPLRQFSCTQRLFGPLGRPSGRPAFNPLAQKDWGLPRFSSGATAGLSGSVEPPANAALLDKPAVAAGTVFSGKVSPVANSPWDEARLPGYEAGDTQGWTRYRLPVNELAAAGVVVTQHATLHLAGAFVLLLVVALSWWQAGDRPLLLLAVAGVLAVAALLVSVAMIPLASGALLGVLFCLLMRLLRPPRTAPPASPSHAAPIDMPSTVTGFVQVGVVLLALVALLLGSAARGAEPEQPASPPKESAAKAAAATKAAAAAQPVFIPIDEHQQPTGGKYYVPESFYDRLYRRAAVLAEKPQGWLITAATYRASLATEAVSQRLAVEQLSVDFDLQVFSQAVRVRLPFRREETKLLPDQSLLDGRPVQPEWEADGSALVVEIAEPGQYRLELAMRPTTHAGAAAGFDLAIPRLATSRVELTAPEDAPPIEVPSAVGMVRWEDQPRRLLAELGPADRLTVRWPDPAGAAGAVPAIDAEELFWLKIQSGSVVIDARLKLKVVAGQLRRLQLATDPSLQLLPLAGPDAPTIQVHTPAGQPQIIELQWPHAISDRVVLDARFLVAGASSVGNLRLPQLDVLDVRPAKRWLAVSVDAALEHQEQLPGPLDAVAVPEFTTSWGSHDGSPLFACRLAEGPSQWSMATRPRRPEIAVDQTLALGFDGQQASVQLDARLTPSSGYVFQYRLLAPAELQIEQLSVLAGNVQQAARWSQDRQGAITVFLAAPAAGEEQLSLRGRLPAPEGRKMPLPLLEIEDGRVNSSIIRLFRQPAVLVQVDHLQGLVETKGPPPDANRAARRCAAGCFRVEEAATPQATLTIVPNHPDVEAEQVVRLLPVGKSWQAVFACRLHIRGGVLDQLTLDAPASWNGPWKVSPADALRLVATPADSRRLVLDAIAPLAGDFQCTIAGPIETPPGERVALPPIGLQQTSAGKCFVVLPKQFHDETIAWDTDGLRAVRRPDLTAGLAATCYEVVNRPCRATLRATETAGNVAQVRRADIRIAWQADGHCRGTASFDVEPGKAVDCPLWMPAGFRLVQATVGGNPLSPAPVGPHSWLLPLGSERTVQRVAIVFDSDTAECPHAAAEPARDQEPVGPGIEAIDSALPFSAGVWRRFRAPMLGGLPVEQTRWTIVGPAAFGPGAAEDDAAVGAAPGDDVNVPLGEAALWQASLDDPRQVTQRLIRGRADVLVLRYAPVGGRWFSTRLGEAVLAALLVLALAWVLRRGTFRQSLARWPHAFGIVLGLAWWLWLSPSAIGLALVAALVGLRLYGWLGVLLVRLRQKGRGWIAKN